MNLESRYADGQLAALARLKLAFPAATHPVVQQSATLQSQPAKPMSQQAQQRLEPPTTPFSVSQLFDVHEQAHTRSEPMRKLSAENLCTSCRKEKHYGTCARPISIKRADFNKGMIGGDPSAGDNPSTSPHYHSATTGDSALARARDGRPADEQAATYFADLFRHQGQVNLSDEPGRMSGGLNKVATLPRAFQTGELVFSENPIIQALSRRALAGRRLRAALQSTPRPLSPSVASAFQGLIDRGQQMKNLAQSYVRPGQGLADAIQRGKLGGLHKVAKVDMAWARLRASPRFPLLDKMFGLSQLAPKQAGWQLWGTDSHSTHEDRGPTPNPYEERPTRKSSPVGFGDEGSQRIRRAFDQVDGAVDTTSVGGGFGTPAGGPAVLG